MISKHPLVLLGCLFVAMIGFGITTPVLPFNAERFAPAEDVSRQSLVIHVGLLTGVYAPGQLVFAPVPARLSDREVEGWNCLGDSAAETGVQRKQ